MNKNEQTAKALSDLITSIRTDQTEYNRDADNKVAGLEIAYEALTGEKPPKVEGPPPPKRASTPAPSKRRGMKIDRKAAVKTFEFLKERGDKTTTVKMIARKFNISDEAASQRLLKLFKDGTVARVSLGQYIVAPEVTGKTKTTEG